MVGGAEWRRRRDAQWGRPEMKMEAVRGVETGRTRRLGSERGTGRRKRLERSSLGGQRSQVRGVECSGSRDEWSVVWKPQKGL